MKRAYWTWIVSSAGALLLPLFLATPVSAQSQTSPDELQQLKNKLQQLEQEMGVLKGQIEKLDQQRSASTAATASPSAPATLAPATAPESARPRPSTADTEAKIPPATIEVYGAAVSDVGYNFNQSDPNWVDMLRPTKLSGSPNQFAPDGTVYFGVRPSRFGVKSSTPTSLGDLKTLLEFDLLGTGNNVGQTTLRLRHAWGELGQFGAGQTWSTFMDPDVSPSALEYYGPNALVWLRNIQLRWMPLQGKTRLWFAIEKPGATADGGVYSDYVALQKIKSKFDMPDFSWQLRTSREWGYLQVAGLFKKITWIGTNRTATTDISGSAFGWGLDLSSTVKFGSRDTGKFALVYGEGIENYINDAPINIGVKDNSQDARRPIIGEALPVLGASAFLEHSWNKRFSSTVGYSFMNIDNSNGEKLSDLHQGGYALADLIYSPVKNLSLGGEYQFGRRVNFADGFNTNDNKLQFTFKYRFSKIFNY